MFLPNRGRIDSGNVDGQELPGKVWEVKTSEVMLSQSPSRKMVQLQEKQEGGLIQRWWMILAGGGDCSGAAPR